MGVGEAVAMFVVVCTVCALERDNDRVEEELAMVRQRVKDVLRVGRSHGLNRSKITRNLVHAARRGASSGKMAGWTELYFGC